MKIIPATYLEHQVTAMKLINEKLLLGHTGEEVSRTVSYSNDGEIKCVWLTTLKAHQQPIVCLDCEGGRLLTGSQDHTIKVSRLLFS